MKNFQFFSTLTFVGVTKPNANVLAFIDVGSIGRPASEEWFAVVENKGLLAGKVIYFAFDPATVSVETGAGKNMLLNTLLYMLGAKG